MISVVDDVLDLCVVVAAAFVVVDNFRPRNLSLF